MKEEEVSGVDVEDVSPLYNLVSDHLRRCAPSDLQCTVFCGGRKCKYETPESWDSAHMAIRGIYSHWVTDDILAMARPCTEIINKRNVIKQFQSLGLRSLVNLQEPGEHGYCGCPLEPSGFTYDPATFMENGISYYNYAWHDYGDVKGTRLLDMVKIICHGLSEGKLAIHCHAGLGRTGALIACFLVYNMRLRANEAIQFVRLKRPNSMQTRGQILCVQNFERLLLKQPTLQEANLPHYIQTQSIMLHGFEARCIKYIPKIMYVVCERLLQLCGCDPIAVIPKDHHTPTTLHFITARKNPSHYHHINNLISVCSRMKSKRHTEISNTDRAKRKETDGLLEPPPVNIPLEEEIDSNIPTEPLEDELNNNFETDAIKEFDNKSLPEMLTNKTDNNGQPELITEATICQTESLAESFESIGQPEQLLDEVDNNDETDDRKTEDIEQKTQLESSDLNITFSDNNTNNVNDSGDQRELESLAYLDQPELSRVAVNKADFTVHDVVVAITRDLEDMDAAHRKLVTQYQLNLTYGESCWKSLQNESQLEVLAGLLTDWMEQLKDPIIDRDLLCQIIIHADDPLACLQKFDYVTQYTIEYLFRFLAHLTPISNEDSTYLVQRIVAALTHQAVLIRGTLVPREKDFCKLRKGTYNKIMEFSVNLLDCIKMNITKNNFIQEY